MTDDCLQTQPPPLRVKCEYALPDILETMVAMRKRMRRKTLPVFAVYLAVVGGLVWWTLQPTANPPRGFTTAPSQSGDSWLGMLLWLGMMVIFIGFVYWWRRHLTKRQFQYFGPLQRPHTFEFQGDLVLVHEPLARHEYYWDAFDRVKETSNLFLLFVAEFNAHIVTKRSFSNEADLAGFREMIRVRIDAPKTSRQSFPVIPMASAVDSK